MTTRQLLPQIPVLPSDDSLLGSQRRFTDFGKSFAFDFDADPADFALSGGQFNLIEGLDKVKQWIRKTLAVTKNIHPIYSSSYGTELNDLIGRGFTIEAISVIIEDIMKRTLFQNIEIRQIDNFITEVVRDGIKVNFRVTTIDNSTFNVEDTWVAF